MTQRARFHSGHRAAIVAALLAAMLLPMGCGDGDAADSEEGEPAAYTIGDPITDSTYAVIVTTDTDSDTLTAQAFRTQLPQIRQQAPMIGLSPGNTDAMRRFLVEAFARQQVVDDAVRDIEPDTASIGQQMRQARSQFETEEAFQEAMAARGLTEDSLRSVFADQSRRQTLQEQFVADTEEPSEADINAYREERAQQIRAQHVLFRLGPNADAAQEDSVQNLANAVLDSIEAGELDFATAAQRYSADGSASEGGNLGYFSKGQMVPPFEEAAFALADSGAVASEPVKTNFGYHLIRKTGEREGQMPDTSAARQAILQERQREAVQDNINRLLSGATVRINPDVVEGVDLSESFEMPRPRG